MKTILGFVLSACGFFFLLQEVDKGNTWANWILFGLGVVFLVEVIRTVWGD